MNPESTNTSCIFIPLGKNDVMRIRAWIHRMASTKSEDEELANDINKSLEEVLKTHGLTYREEEYGEMNISKVRLQLGSNGICIPEVCFLNPPLTLPRINEALRPFKTSL